MTSDLLRNRMEAILLIPIMYHNGLPSNGITFFWMFYSLLYEPPHTYE